MYYLKVNRGLAFTKPGIYITGLVLILGMVAIGTGINGFYLFLGLGLGLIIISGLVSEKIIRAIKVEFEPRYISEANKELSIPFEAINTNQKNSIYGLNILLVGQAEKMSLVSKINLGIAVSHISSLNPNSKLSMTLTGKGLDRGLYLNLRCLQKTLFPFAMLDKFKFSSINTNLIITPNINNEQLEKAEQCLNTFLTDMSVNEEFYSHRNYFYGDSRKFIDYKKSTSKNPEDWQVKTYKRQNIYNVCLKISNEDLESSKNEREYEYYISLVAAFIKVATMLNIKSSLLFDGNLISIESSKLEFLASLPIYSKLSATAVMVEKYAEAIKFQFDQTFSIQNGEFNAGDLT